MDVQPNVLNTRSPVCEIAWPRPPAPVFGHYGVRATFYNIDLINFTSGRELFKVTFQTLLIETATKNLPQVLVLKNCLLHFFRILLVFSFNI